MWFQIPYNERYKLINVYSLSRFRWPLDSQSKISKVFGGSGFFTGFTRDEIFNIKVALKVKIEQFIRTRGLRKVSPSCKFALNLFCRFVIDLF